MLREERDRLGADPAAAKRRGELDAELADAGRRCTVRGARLDRADERVVDLHGEVEPTVGEAPGALDPSRNPLAREWTTDSRCRRVRVLEQRVELVLSIRAE
jgi:hypothetical protein